MKFEEQLLIRIDIVINSSKKKELHLRLKQIQQKKRTKDRTYIGKSSGGKGVKFSKAVAPSADKNI